MKKLLISFTVALILTAAFLVLGQTGLFQQIETEFYNNRVLETVDESLGQVNEIFSEYENNLLGRFEDIISDESFRRSYAVNQVQDDINRRTELIQNINRDFPAFVSLRVFDEDFTQLHYSSRLSDIDSRGPSGIRYLPVEQLDIEVGSLESQASDIDGESTERRRSINSEFQLIEYMFPVYNNVEIFSGYALASINTSSLNNMLTRNRLIPFGQTVRLFPPDGMILNPPQQGENVVDTLASRWEALKTREDITLDIQNQGEVLVRIAEGENISSVSLVPLDELQLTSAMKIFLSSTLFFTGFLVLLLLLNLRQDSEVVVRDRVKRFQLDLLKEAVDKKGNVDLQKWQTELRVRKNDLKKQLTKGISERDSQRYSDLIDSSWEDILDVLGSRQMSNQLQSNANVNFDPAHLEQLVENILARLEHTGINPQYLGTKSSSVSSSQPIQTPPPQTEAAENLEPVEELEDAQELEAADDSIAEAEAVEDLEAAEDLEAVEELEDAQELEAAEDSIAEAEPVEDLEAAEDLEPVEELEDAQELEAADDSIAEAEPVEDLEAAEDLEPVEELEDAQELEASDDSIAEAEEILDDDSLETGEEPGQDSEKNSGQYEKYLTSSGKNDAEGLPPSALADSGDGIEELVSSSDFDFQENYSDGNSSGDTAYRDVEPETETIFMDEDMDGEYEDDSPEVTPRYYADIPKQQSTPIVKAFNVDEALDNIRLDLPDIAEFDLDMRPSEAMNLLEQMGEDSVAPASDVLALKGPAVYHGLSSLRQGEYQMFGFGNQTVIPVLNQAVDVEIVGDVKDFESDDYAELEDLDELREIDEIYGDDGGSPSAEDLEELEDLEDLEDVQSPGDNLSDVTYRVSLTDMLENSGDQGISKPAIREDAEGMPYVSDELYSSGYATGRREFKDLVEEIVGSGHDDDNFEENDSIHQILQAEELDLDDMLSHEKSSENDRDFSRKAFYHQRSAEGRLTTSSRGIEYDSFESQFQNPASRKLRSMMKLTRQVNAQSAVIIDIEDDAELNNSIGFSKADFSRISSADISTLKHIVSEQEMMYVGSARLQSLFPLFAPQKERISGAFFAPIHYQGKTQTLALALTDSIDDVNDFVKRNFMV